jgi:hypothetical protein
MLVNIEAISQRIRIFSAEIAACFDNSDWENLAMVLSGRQTYLEEILACPVDAETRQALANLVELILAQDAESLKEIQAQKKKLLELHLMLENGQRAVKAYRAG